MSRVRNASDDKRVFYQCQDEPHLLLQDPQAREERLIRLFSEQLCLLGGLDRFNIRRWACSRETHHFDVLGELCILPEGFRFEGGETGMRIVWIVGKDVGCRRHGDSKRQ